MSQEDNSLTQDKTISSAIRKKAEKVKQHLQDNKKTYLIAAGTSVGTVAICVIATRYAYRTGATDLAEQILERMPAQTIIAPVMNNTVNNNIDNNLGRVSKIVRDVETGQEWSKIRYLAEKIAEEHGITYDSARTRISQHLHGLSDHVFDKQYEIVGLRTDI